jgi:hypothetical protein
MFSIYRQLIQKLGKFIHIHLNFCNLTDMKHLPEKSGMLINDYDQTWQEKQYIIPPIRPSVNSA